MSLYVLDTDILSLFQIGHPQVTQQVHSHSRGDLAITVITVEEQISGWYALLRKTKKPDQLSLTYERLINAVQFLAIWRILNYTEPAIATFQSLKAMKLHVRAHDLRIAAIALENAAILVTRNAVDFKKIPGLSIENWAI